ncbi:hypothetical protein [Streptomyces sp. NPDC005760]|uniref:hypothetical protein n=1 Tax=Streptomyces sp. NPDC005760 TaxID=3156718 RepID=UPI0033F28A35
MHGEPRLGELLAGLPEELSEGNPAEEPSRAPEMPTTRMETSALGDAGPVPRRRRRRKLRAAVAVMALLGGTGAAAVARIDARTGRTLRRVEAPKDGLWLATVHDGTAFYARWENGPGVSAAFFVQDLGSGKTRLVRNVLYGVSGPGTFSVADVT